MNKTTSIQPPSAEKIPHVMEDHGHIRTDNYYWMRDDKRQDKKVIAYLNAENEYKDSQFKAYEPLQKSLFKELTNRLDKDESSVPYLWHGQWYYQRYQTGSEYPIIARKNSLDSHEVILLDVNERADGNDFYGLGELSVSPNGQLLAFTEDTLSRRIYTVIIKNLKNNQYLQDRIEGIDGNIVWANDNQHIFYIAKDPQTLLGFQVFRHKLGTMQAEDVLVFEEKDDTFYLELDKTLDESLITLSHDSTITSEISILDANQPLSTFTPMLPRKEGHEYTFKKLKDTFYILTNWQAKNYRLMKVPASQANNQEAWQEVIAHDNNVLIEDYLVLEDYLVIQTRENGLNHIHIFPFNEQPAFELSFDDAAYVASLDANSQQASNKLRVSYSSPNTPESIFEYTLSSANDEALTTTRLLLKQENILGGFKTSAYKTERLFITARDGEQVPVTLVYRKDKFNKDGKNPLYQYGYGAYGYTIEPHFKSSIISLLDRGFVYATAHVRGSDMLGRAWYDEGRMLNKQNSFNDFIDITQTLTDRGYADKNKVVASGGSAGGLLMGAVLNQAPERYFAVASHVPFVDVVTTMQDESIPLTTNEYDEWGNPSNPAYYEYMLSYSPYDQIKAQNYPHLLVTTGLHDSQVQYFEPAKWVAKLREYKTDDNLLLFETDMEAGHGGKSGRYRRYQDTAKEYAFFLGLLDFDK
ncbi:S9 family peptidase [Shewanella surugensis]|uniref:S9 family peptidase n=2 Tax=Shewanella surugensis TaxID=212020 RepID=A0ABT0LIK2_9GAMM|nr:S9 family peptidase [Shewanella surugensis]MCL1127419.1 S9 family peptidase [Shewanella surugensis]